ncbi:MAG: molybdopterin-dependent oxidoreductase [Planctomycetaceae bacterium]|nr:molybdopterin-dependent oxidoreductase [Planctomycetaceae bacterium]
MSEYAMTRRDVMRAGLSSAATGLALMSSPQFVFPAETEGEELVPFLDTPRTPPNRLDWETLDSWITPQDQVFNVQHYGEPEVGTEGYQLEIGGLVDSPRTLSLDDLKSLPQEERLMTLECSGNGASSGFMNAIYNSRWVGTPLAPLLRECGNQSDATEVVFFGHDTKEETLRPDTKRELTIEVPFGRSLSLEDALSLPAILAYERNGEPIAPRNGAPLRLIVPGWYGIANVKWLRRIEVRDRRYMGRYMGRDYVTVRGERQGDEVVFVESSVSRMNLKSIIARVTRGATVDSQVPLKAYGAVWHTDVSRIKGVEVQLNNGEWRPAQLDEEPRSKHSWVFFSIDLGIVEPGKLTLVSRAIDTNGHIQPSAEDDEIALKKTYWEAYQQWPREIEVTA